MLPVLHCLIMLVDQKLYFSNLGHRIQSCGLVGNQDDLRRYRPTGPACTILFLVILSQESPETLDVLRSIFVDANLLGVVVCLHESFQELLLEMHGAAEPLVVGTNRWLERDHVKVELPGCDHSLNQVAKARLGSSCEEDCQGVWLFLAEPDQLNNLFVPPSLPGARFLLLVAFSCRCQDA